MDTKEKLAYILKQFRIEGEILVYRWIPTGHINTAYYVALYNGKEMYQFLVQQVNTYVFRDPVGMMRNIELLTEHVRKAEPKMEKRRRLHFRHTQDRRNYIVLHDGVVMGPGEPFDPLDERCEFWRVYNYIEYSKSFETAEGDPAVLRRSGEAFGRFLKQLSDFDASKLIESIPHFHDTAYRLQSFFETVAADPCSRAAHCAEEIRQIRENADFGCTLCRQIERGELPLRVTHNDTKLNNVMVDEKTGRAVCVIDLDTVMPGSALYDFGDAIRFGASSAAEDETDLEKVFIRTEYFESFLEGFLTGLDGALTPCEIEMLPRGAWMMTIEVGIRFLADYLDGDRYFRVEYPQHNLDRARNQFKLVADLEEKWDALTDIARRYS